MASSRPDSRASTPPKTLLRTWASPLVAEFIGTFALTFMGAGAIIMTGGKDLVAIAFAHGLAIGLMVAASGHLSGGLFNPAVAIGLAIGRVIRVERAVAFIVVEFIGAVCAALVLKAIFTDSMINAVNFGTPSVGPGFTASRAFVSEIVLSFFLMYVIYGVAVDRRGPAVIAGLAIGLTITMDIFANGAVGGAAMNPSRHFGVALIGNHWSDWWIWYTAPFIGMAIAAFVYVYIHLHGTERPEPA